MILAGGQVIAGTGNDPVSNSGGTSITLYGGSGDDTVSTTGGAAVELAAEGGINVYQVSGPTSQTDPIVLNDWRPSTAARPTTTAP